MAFGVVNAQQIGTPSGSETNPSEHDTNQKLQMGGLEHSYSQFSLVTFSALKTADENTSRMKRIYRETLYLLSNHVSCIEN